MQNNKNKNKKSIKSDFDENNKKSIISMDNIQIASNNGRIVSAIVPIEEFDKMLAAVIFAEDLLEGEIFEGPNGKKATFYEIVNSEAALAHAECKYEIDKLSSKTCCDNDDDDTLPF